MADILEEEYEVEKILDHRFLKKGKKTDITYFIKWLNYGEEDNTWEREANVYAVDLIIEYWEKFSKNSEDRLLFEQIQSRKKKPIVLPTSKEKVSPPSTLKTNKITDLFTKKDTDQQREITSHSIASSSSPAPVPTVKKQQSLSDIFKSVGSAVTSGSLKGKEKETIDQTEPAVSVVKRTPTVVANDEDDVDKSDSDEEARETLSHRSTHTEEEEKDEIIDSEEEEPVIISASQKRKRASYSDYFLEQHEKKKRRESQGGDSDSSMTSSIVSSKSTPKDQVDGNEQIIFDEHYSKEPPIDWATLALKVEYVGKELPESPIYCTVRWKDGVRSIHPLNLVREKRPDLVIDHFIDLINTKQASNK